MPRTPDGRPPVPIGEPRDEPRRADAPDPGQAAGEPAAAIWAPGHDPAEAFDAASRRIERVHREWVATLDALPDPIFVCDAEGLLVRVNRAYAASAGAPVRALLGRPYWEVLPRLDGPLPLDGEEAGGEVQAGDGRTLRYRLCPVANPAATGWTHVGTLQEVGDSGCSRAALRRSAAQFRRFAASVADIVGVLAPDGVIRHLSPSVRSLLGYAPQALVGLRAEDLVHPADRAALGAQVRGITGEPGASTTAQLRLRHSNGEWRLFEAMGRSVGRAGRVEQIVVSARDVTERDRTQSELARRLAQLEVVATLGERALGGGALDDLLDAAVCAVARTLGVARVQVLERAGEGARYRVRACSTGAAGGRLSACPQADRALAGRVPVVLAEDGVGAASGLPRGVAVPIADHREAFGVLGVFSAEPRRFCSDDIRFLESVAHVLALAAERTRRARAERRAAAGLHGALVGTVEAIALAVEKRDPYTAGHERQVAVLARDIAHALGLSDQRVQGVYLGALIHDVGKLQVPLELLNRPGSLSAAEREVLRRHPQVGHEILCGVAFPWPVAEIVLQHHERLDGSGYPAGLAGEAILPEARILAVADVVEAIASHRPYRASLGLAAAIEEIGRHRGTLYDPRAVEACVDILGQRGMDWVGRA